MTDEDALTEDRAIEGLRNFFREKPFVFFGTGMSCALDSQFGMRALAYALTAGIGSQTLPAAQQKEWRAVDSALRGEIDLESALNSVSNKDLLRSIVEISGSFVSELDKRYAYLISNGEVEWPAIGLVRKLVEALPDGDPILHVLTPNYDMLFEYAWDFAHIPYTNGLFGGIERTKDWDAVDRAFWEPRKVRRGTRMRTCFKLKKHVRLHKVHGSLNYFFHRECVIGLLSKIRG